MSLYDNLATTVLIFKSHLEDNLRSYTVYKIGFTLVQAKLSFTPKFVFQTFYKHVLRIFYACFLIQYQTTLHKVPTIPQN